MNQSQPLKSIEISRVIIRADGTREPEAVVAYWHRNPLKRYAARLRGVKGKVKIHAHRGTAS